MIITCPVVWFPVDELESVSEEDDEESNPSGITVDWKAPIKDVTSVERSNAIEFLYVNVIFVKESIGSSCTAILHRDSVALI